MQHTFTLVIKYLIVNKMSSLIIKLSLKSKDIQTALKYPAADY